MKFNPLKGAIIALMMIAFTLFSIVLYEKFVVKKDNITSDTNISKCQKDVIKNRSTETIEVNKSVKTKPQESNITELNQSFKGEYNKTVKKIVIEDVPSEIKDYKLSKDVKVSKRSKEIKTNIFCTQKVKHKKKKKESDVVLNKTAKDAKIAIIMDDVSFFEQIDEINSLPFVITPAIFPPTRHHPDTIEISKRASHYMIHLPMEAFHYFTPEDSTLLVSDSSDEIMKKVTNVIEQFPDLIAINNHTGSKFTANAEAMDKLFCSLGSYGVPFIDSRTTAHTQAKRVGKLYNQDVLERNFFLDNKANVSYIKKQLKQAVRYAKKHGLCIAICHPRDATFKALKRSEEILKDVKVVYINELLK